MKQGISSTQILMQSNNKEKDDYLGQIEYKLLDGRTFEIAQWHNPRIFLDDLYGENQTKQFTSVMLIGSPGTGKTTLATFIGHGMHNRNPNYYVQHLRRDDLLKFDHVINNLPPGRDVVLIFDDVSLVFKDVLNPQQKSKILTTLTEARHPKLETSDRKVMVIVNVHYENSMEKMWRSQGSWKFYTDMSGDEAQVFNQKTKSRFSHKVERFQKTVLDQFRKKEFTVSLSQNRDKTYVTGGAVQDNKKSLYYKEKGVFRFIMCYDTIGVRFYLVPAEYCGKCSLDGSKLQKTEATPEEIDDLLYHYYGKDGRLGLKDALVQFGIYSQYRNKRVYACNMAMDLLSFFDVDKEALGLWLREKAKITDKKLSGIRRKKADFFKDLMEIRAKHKSPLGNLTINKMQKYEEDEDEIDLEL